MITELYALDQELTENSAGNDVTFEIMEKSGSAWATSFTLSPSQVVAESMELSQTICDEDELVIGGCIPTQLTLSVMNITQDLTGKRIAVKIRGRYHSNLLYPTTVLYPSDSLYPGYISGSAVIQTDQYVLFIGTIISYKRCENKRIRRIIALDRLYEASTILCKEATYNYINDNFWDPPPSAGEPQTLHMNNLRSHFCSKGKVTPPSLSDFINRTIAFDINPANFDSEVDRDFTPLQGLKWYCELNAAFWIEDMPENLTVDKATPRNILLYRDKTTYYSISTYSQLNYEDFVVKGIHEATFCAHGYNKNEFATIKMNPTDGYSAYNSNNGLARSMQTASDSSTPPTPDRSIYPAVQNLVAHGSTGPGGLVNEPHRILGDIYSYRPFKASIFNRWWVQVGDRVQLPVDDDSIVNVQSIVMSRKIKGINSMTVTIEAKGLEIQGKDFNTINE